MYAAFVCYCCVSLIQEEKCYPDSEEDEETYSFPCQAQSPHACSELSYTQHDEEELIRNDSPDQNY